MANKVAFFALVSALVAAAAGCSGGGSSADGAVGPTVAGNATSVSSGTPAANAVGPSASSAGTSGPAKASPAKAGPAQPSGGTSTASGSAHATNATDHISLSPSTTTNVVAWYHGKGGTAFTSLTKVLDQASQANASGGVTAFGKTCGQIGSTAKAAQAAPPMPVPNAAGWYTSALKGYVQSSADCEQGVSTQDTKLLQQAEGEVEANNSDLNRAAAVLIAALSAGK